MKLTRYLTCLFVCLLTSLASRAQQQPTLSLEGQVLGDDSLGIFGASVYVKGTSTGTTTDIDGRFRLNVAPEALVIFQALGYERKELAVPSSGPIRVILAQKDNRLNEVVVTGYQVQKKADLTGAVSVVDVGDMKKQSSPNPVQSLQGKVAGMVVTTDGTPSGSNTAIRIRGIGTLNNNDPLFIIDGVPTTGGMHELNPNDIETIQVLKDASAASIYGSRAANGVIIITTRKGKTGKQELRLNHYTSLSFYNTRQKMLDAEGYGKVLFQAFANAGKDPNTNTLLYRYQWHVDDAGNAQLDRILLPEYLDARQTLKSSNTNWYNEISNQPGVIQNYDVSASNGTEKGHYLFGLGYFQNKGIIKTTDFNRLSARLNSDTKLLGGRLTISENLTLNKTRETPLDGGVLNLAVQNLPVIPVHTADGTGWGGPIGGMNDRQNSVRLLYNNQQNHYDYLRVFGNAFAELEIVKGLSFRTSYGVDYGDYFAKNFRKKYQSGYLQNDVNKLTLTQNHSVTTTMTNVLNFNRDFGRHHLDAVLGQEYIHNRVSEYFASREGYEVEDADYLTMDAGTGTKNNGGFTAEYALLSFFGKLNYSFKGRYLASVTLRRDGSSRFGSNNRYGTFPAFSLGWRVNEEPLLAEKLASFSDLKLRFGYGLNGNQAIDNNAIYTLYMANYAGGDPTWSTPRGTAYALGGNTQGTLPSGYVVTQSANPNLRWEQTAMANYGLDFGLFNQALYGSVDAFVKKTSDILVKPPYLAVLGEGGGQWVNGASIENRGLELALGYRGQVRSVRYEANGNWSAYRNKVTDLPKAVVNSYGGNGTTDNILGKPLGSFYGYVADGLFTTQAQLDNSATQVGKGLGRIRYRDLNGDGVIDAKDQTWIGNPNPRYTYGINLSVKWSQFDASIFLQGVGNVDVVNGLKYHTDFWSVSETGSNKGARLLDAWSPSNPNSTIPAISLTDANSESRFSTYFIENGSYLKLRNVQIGYTLPDAVLRRFRMTALRIYVGGDNLALLAKSKSFTGLDPENPSFNYPRPLVLTGGFSLAF